MQLEEFLGKLRGASDETLCSLYIHNNFLILMDADFSSVTQQLAQKYDWLLHDGVDGRHYYTNSSQTIVINPFAHHVGTMVTVPNTTQPERLLRPEIGILHVDKQLGYPMGFSLHPHTGVRPPYHQQLAEVICAIGEFSLLYHIPVCMPKVACPSFRVVNDKFDFNYDLIVYHEP